MCSLPVRLSQDLAKDLAILAREIHDVAGDGELQNPGVDSSAPGSTVTTHEQVHQTLTQSTFDQLTKADYSLYLSFCIHLSVLCRNTNF